MNLDTAKQKVQTAEAADLFVEAKRLMDDAEANLAAARDLFLTVVGEDEAVASDGTRVKVVVQERTTFDLDILTDNVAPATLDKVTKVSADTAKVRKAVEMGLISPEVAEFAANVSEVVSVRVYPAL
jgi:hypothetical protein